MSIRNSMNITTETDHVTIICDIVKEMYKNGSDSRSEKNGNPMSFVESLVEDGEIVVVGLWKYLPPDFQALIGNKELFLRTMTYEQKLFVLKFIRNNAGTYKPKDYYCYIKNDFIRKIDELLSGEERHSKFFLQLRKYFRDTERQKFAGKADNKYTFNPSTYDKSLNMMKMLVKC